MGQSLHLLLCLLILSSPRLGLGFCTAVALTKSMKAPQLPQRRGATKYKWAFDS